MRSAPSIETPSRVFHIAAIRMRRRARARKLDRAEKLPAANVGSLLVRVAGVAARASSGRPAHRFLGGAKRRWTNPRRGCSRRRPAPKARLNKGLSLDGDRRPKSRGRHDFSPRFVRR